MADELTDLLAQIEGKATEPDLSLGEKAVGYLRSAASGPTFNFADEIEAAISPGSYEENIFDIRENQKRFKRLTPYTDNAVEIASAFINPFGPLIGWGGKAINAIRGVDKGAKAVKAAQKIANPTTNAGLLRSLTHSSPGQAVVGSTLHGVGAGEDLEERAKLGALGLGIGTAGAAAGNIFGRTGQSAGKEADKLKLSAYGIKGGQIQKLVKKAGKGSDKLVASGKIPLVKVLKDAEKTGLVNAADDITVNVGNVLGKQADLSKTLGAVLQKADDVIPPSREIGVKHLKKYIDGLTGKAKELAVKTADDELEAISRQIRTGTIRELQDMKVGLNYKWDQSAYTPSIVKALRSDLKEEIEKRVNQAAQKGILPTELNGAVKAINRQWGDLAELKDAFITKIGADYGTDAVEKVFNASRTSGGVGSFIQLAGQSGGGKGIIPTAIGVGLTAARVPEAKSSIADVIGSKAGRFVLGKVGTGLKEGVRARPIAEAYLNQTEDLTAGASEEQKIEELKGLLDQIQSLGGEPQKKTKEFPTDPPPVASDEGMVTSDIKYTAEMLQPFVISQESGGDASAESSVGAKGLMQLMDATGKEWHKKLKIKEPYNPKNAKQNKKIGTAYLQHLLDMFDGDPELALTAYHSGPGRVKKALRLSGGTSLDSAMTIPLNKGGLGPVGRKYARQVLGRMES